MRGMTQTPHDVITFWRDAGPEAWFAKIEIFDASIRTNFEPLHHAAARNELNTWEDSAEGALTLLLLLDQFPRNMYRGSAHAFATDPLAAVSQTARSTVGSIRSSTRICASSSTCRSSTEKPPPIRCAASP